MSAPKKLKATPTGKPDSELTRFKELWRDSFTDAQRSYWRSQFLSKTATAETRESLRIKTGINLVDDDQVVRFRKWDQDEQKRQDEAERMQADEEHFQPEVEQQVRAEMAGQPELVILSAIAERLRAKVLNAATHRSLATGDFGLGLSAVRASQAEQSGKFNAEIEKAKLELQRQAEARAQKEFQLALEKFQFDAAKHALAAVKELKTISASKLTDVEKITQARLALFGELPDEPAKQT